jgi:hypothetical protein
VLGADLSALGALLSPAALASRLTALTSSSPSGPTLRLVVERTEALELLATALESKQRGPLLLAPFYRSPFGNKIVDGVSLEEGEEMESSQGRKVAQAVLGIQISTIFFTIFFSFHLKDNSFFFS